MLPLGLPWHDWSAHPWAMVLDAPPAASDWLPVTEWSTPCTQNRRLTCQQGRRRQVSLPNGHRQRLVMALGARLPGVAGKMSSRVTSARRGRDRPSGLIMDRSHPCDGQFPLVQILANAGTSPCANQANVAVVWKLGWYRCQRSARRDVAPGMFSPDRSVAGNLNRTTEHWYTRTAAAPRWSGL
jgi:hypothetical protein